MMCSSVRPENGRTQCQGRGVRFTRQRRGLHDKRVSSRVRERVEPIDQKSVYDDS
jgi:hypothetical protein